MTVDEMWRELSATIIREGTPESAREAMKSAFYAGIFAFMREQISMAERMSEDEGAVVLEGYANEIKAYFEERKQEHQRYG